MRYSLQSLSNSDSVGERACHVTHNKESKEKQKQRESEIELMLDLIVPGG